MKKEFEYYLVHKSAIPDFFEKVLIAKKEVELGKSVSSVCKELDISRSTFYKYKDLIFETNIIPSEDAYLKINYNCECLDDITSYFYSVGIKIKSLSNNDNFYVMHIEFPLIVDISKVMERLSDIENIIDIENIGNLDD